MRIEPFGAGGYSQTVAPDGGLSNSLSQGANFNGAQSGDFSQISAEAREAFGPRNSNVHVMLGALSESFGQPGVDDPSGPPPAIEAGPPGAGAAPDGAAGPKHLVNPSAHVVQDCIGLLSSLGESIPDVGSLATATDVTATPIGSGDQVLQLNSVDGVAKPGENDNLRGLAQRMRANEMVARQGYRGNMPPDVDALIQKTVAALGARGIPV